ARSRASPGGPVPGRRPASAAPGPWDGTPGRAPRGRACGRWRGMGRTSRVRARRSRAASTDPARRAPRRAGTRRRGRRVVGWPWRECRSYSEAVARGIGLGLLAAALFGASIPVTKLLAADADPLVLAGLLYLGAGAALALLRLLRPSAEAKLRRSDVPWLLGIVVAGAIAGPILLVVGLRRLPGVPAALLLNLEAPLTAVLAVAAFGEHLSPRGWNAAALLAVGAVALGAGPGALQIDGPGAAALVLACAAWALD